MSHFSPDSSPASSSSSPSAMPDPTLVDRFLAGECTAEERARIAAELAREPEAWERILAIQAGFAARKELAVPSMEAAQARLARRLGAEAERRAAHHTKRRRNLYALGAAVSAILLLGVLFARTKPTSSVTKQYRTHVGQWSTISLQGGTTMRLAPATVVSVAPDGINVMGEAYFAVTPNPSRPFVVRTTNAFVQVLGTRFVVRQYTGERSSRVVVEDGKVALRTSQQQTAPIVLAAQTMASVTDSSVDVHRGIVASEYTAWTHGRLAFKEVPLRDVVHELARAYDAEIRLADSTLARQPMTLEASVREEPLAEILDYLTIAVDAHYTRDGKAFVIVPGRSRAPQIKQFPQPEKQYGR